MSDQAEGGAKPKFDPVKLEQLNVARDYPMDEDEFTKLYEHNCYCEMAHINKKGFPIVTPMFYVIIDGILHMSSIKKYRHKVHHLEQNPKISVSIHNDGANVRHQKAILIIGNVASSGETFLLRAQQSRKVVLYGRANSSGAVDYLNLNLLPLDCAERGFGLV